MSYVLIPHGDATRLVLKIVMTGGTGTRRLWLRGTGRWRADSSKISKRSAEGG